MLRRLVLVGLLMAVGRTEEVAGPSNLQIVSVFFSDAGGLFYYRLIEVRQDGDDSVVRYSRVAPLRHACKLITVQSLETRASSTSPAQLLGTNNPCAIKPTALDEAIEHYSAHKGHLEAVSFGIVAHCGSDSIALGLPISQRLDFLRLQSERPEIARLWNLSSDIARAAFGPKDVFHDRSDQEDLALQLGGERVVPELISGRYDTALREAVHGFTGSSLPTHFRSLLRDYRGPVKATDEDGTYVALVPDQQLYHFRHFVAPDPSIARVTHTLGKVDLHLTLDRATGEVLEASAAEGNSILVASAVEAAKQWRFDPTSVRSDTLRITVSFVRRCP